MVQLGFVKPLSNGNEKRYADLEIPPQAIIECPKCGYTWVGSNRTYYTCPKRNGCGHGWSIVKWRKIGDRFIPVEENKGGKTSV